MLIHKKIIAILSLFFSPLMAMEDKSPLENNIELSTQKTPSQNLDLNKSNESSSFIDFFQNTTPSNSQLLKEHHKVVKFLNIDEIDDKLSCLNEKYKKIILSYPKIVREYRIKKTTKQLYEQSLCDYYKERTKLTILKNNI